MIRTERSSTISYVDLHLHLLPGVDDGAQDLPAALEHARRLAAEGVREVVLTPHIGHSWPLDIASIPARTAALQRELDARAIGVHLHPGGEIHPRRALSLTEEQLETLALGPQGRRWLLVEAPFAGIDRDFVCVCEGLRERGYDLLIAHPERATGLLQDGGLELLRTQLEAGAALQVNVCSLLGNHGLGPQEAAVHLLRSGLASVLASDGHPGTREHTLRLGFVLALRAGASSVQGWRLTQANPRFLLRQGFPRKPSPQSALALAAALD